VQPPKLSYLRGTDVASDAEWDAAGQRYEELLSILKKTPAGQNGYAARDEIASAARSIGYYRLCNMLRRGVGSTATVREAWQIVQRVGFDMPTRMSDIANKLDTLESIGKQGPRRIECNSQCVVNGDGSPIPAALAPQVGSEYYEWRFDESGLGRFSAENERLSADGVAIGHSCKEGESAGHAYKCEAEVRSPPLTRPAGFSELVFSWDARTPVGTWLEVVVEGQVGGVWNPPLTVGVWSTDGLRHSIADPAKVVDTDTVHFTPPADAIRVSVRLLSESNAPGADSAILKAVGFSALGREATSILKLGVPEASQMEFENKGKDWCSPTSTAMVMAYWAKARRKDAAWTKPIPGVAQGVFDSAYGFGNWSFNVAYVNAATDGGLRAFVTRLRDLGEAQLLVARGIPIVASIRWSRGDLSGAPLPTSNGHLVVVQGFDANGDVIVNDPAAPGAGQVERTYRRGEFEKAWRQSKNTAYIVMPADIEPQTRALLEQAGVVGAWEKLRMPPI